MYNKRGVSSVISNVLIILVVVVAIVIVGAVVINLVGKTSLSISASECNSKYLPESQEYKDCVVKKAGAQYALENGVISQPEYVQYKNTGSLSVESGSSGGSSNTQTNSVTSNSTNGSASITGLSSSEIINIDFGPSPSEGSPKIGSAVVGNSGDYWNAVVIPWSLDSTVNDLKYADGSSSIISARLTNLGGRWSYSSTMPLLFSDPMLRTFTYQSNNHGGTSYVYLYNLTNGNYNLILYGNEGGTRSQFVVYSGINNYGIKSTTMSFLISNVTNWTEGVHYVAYQNISVNDGTIKIQLDPVGYRSDSSTNGLQLIGTSTLQSNQTNHTDTTCNSVKFSVYQNNVTQLSFNGKIYDISLTYLNQSEAKLRINGNDLPILNNYDGLNFDSNRIVLVNTLQSDKKPGSNHATFVIFNSACDSCSGLSVNLDDVNIDSEVDVANQVYYIVQNGAVISDYSPRASFEVNGEQTPSLYVGQTVELNNSARLTLESFTKKNLTAYNLTISINSTQCAPTVYTCYDSDGGLNYSVKSCSVGRDGTTYCDSCVQNQWNITDILIDEYYCSAGELYHQATACPSGTLCSDGACLPEQNQTNLISAPSDLKFNVSSVPLGNCLGSTSGDSCEQFDANTCTKVKGCHLGDCEGQYMSLLGTYNCTYGFLRNTTGSVFYLNGTPFVVGKYDESSCNNFCSGGSSNCNCHWVPPQGAPACHGEFLCSQQDGNSCKAAGSKCNFIANGNFSYNINISWNDNSNNENGYRYFIDSESSARIGLPYNTLFNGGSGAFYRGNTTGPISIVRSLPNSLPSIFPILFTTYYYNNTLGNSSFISGVINNSHVDIPIPTCSDSDGGLNIYVKGTMFATENILSGIDSCTVVVSGNFSQPENGTGFSPVYNCSGENCYIDEYFTQNISDQIPCRGSAQVIRCLNGCNDGACIQGSSNSIFPSPFVVRGMGDYAIVYGSNSVAGTDNVAAADLNAFLSGMVVGGSGAFIVADTQVSSVSGKNLIVVGGSCVNTVAAKLLGSDVPLCDSDWTAQTSVGPGAFLIKTFVSPYSEGKIATLVAGYEAVDTTNAAIYLKTNNLSTAIGSSLIIGGASTKLSLGENCTYNEQCNSGVCVRSRLSAIGVCSVYNGPTCYDSDNGDYYTRGTLFGLIDNSGGNLSRSIYINTTDICANEDGYSSEFDNYLFEYSCAMRNGINVFSSVSYNCSNGCSNGACIESNSTQTNQTAICTDSDGGLNYYVKGNATNGTSTYMDECSVFYPNRLNEAFCGEGYVEYNAYLCPNGCSNGACLSQTNQTIRGLSVSDVLYLNSSYSGPNRNLIGINYEAYGLAGNWLNLGTLDTSPYPRWQDNNNFIPANGSILLSVSNQANISAQKLTIVSSGGAVNYAFVPAMTGIGSPYAYLFVSEDGSTYWACSSNQPCEYSNARSYLTSNQALVPAHLARSSGI